MNDKQISIGLLVMYCKETHSVQKPSRDESQ